MIVEQSNFEQFTPTRCERAKSWNEVEPNGEPMNENFILLQIFAAGQKEGRKEWQTFLATPDLILFFLFAQFFFVLNI